MKIKLTKEHIQHLCKFGLFLGVVLIILQLFPTQRSFGYKYEVGTPWTHDLLTASFDFPIYKSDEQLEQERAELLRTFVPYFQFDTEASAVQFERFVSDFQAQNNIQPLFQDTIRRRFDEIYAVGIISAEKRDSLLARGIQQINCIFPDRTERRTVADFHTPETAYEAITQQIGGMLLSRTLLSAYNLNLYLIENVTIDKITSEMAERELLRTISPTIGAIQAGERIIDRGEIVTPHVERILQSLKIEYERQQSGFRRSSLVVFGQVVLVFGFMMLLFAYFYLFRPRMYENYGNLILVLVLIVLITALTAFTIRFHSDVIHYYMVPFALLPIILRVFFDVRTALYTHVVTSVIIAFMVSYPFEFLVLQISGGMLAISTLKDLAERSQLAKTALYIFLSYSVVYIGYSFVIEGEFSQINWLPIAYFAISSILLLLAYILIYFFEKIFGLISSVTLMELTNINSDLMMKFAETAPGTFQHSLQVSNIATEAAKKIGANSLLVRTGALYHDIGKMQAPGFFTENQLGGHNPLLEKSCEDAAQTIISHITDGIKIAKKYHLPEQIINFIGTHHGTSKVRYFYNSFINANPGVEPNEALFTYPGPLPTSKETAILMMADAVEARSRSLKEYSETEIRNMVEDMIDMQIAEGQFKDAPITFQDVETVKKVFTEKLINIYHTRIAYPKTEQKV